MKVVVAIVVGATCLLPASSGAMRGVAAPAMRPGVEAEGAVAGWHIALGGFSGLRDAASARVTRWDSDGTESIVGVTWAIDPHRIGGGATAARNLTAMIRIENGLARVSGVVDGVLLQALAIADGAGDVGFAVGYDGAMARLAGERWVRITSPIGASLGSIDLYSPASGWAVGSRSTILRWDGGRWAIEAVPAELDSAAVIADVAAVSAENAWAVTTDGLMLKRDTAGWHVEMDAPRLTGFSSIAFDGPDLGLAAGDGVLEYRGGVWRELSVDDGSYSDVAWSGRIGYLVRDGEVLRLLDGRLDPVVGEGFTTPLEDRRIDRLFTLAPDRNELIGIARQGVMVRVNELRAFPMWPPVTNASSLAVTSDEYGWIGGTVSPAGLVGAADDGAWRRTSIEEPGVTITDIDAPVEGVAWAAGYLRSEVGGVSSFVDKAWRWDSDAWAEAHPPSGVSFDGISALSHDEAVSARGDAIMRWDGSGWVPVEGAPEGAQFGDAQMVAGGEDPSAWEGWFGGIGEGKRSGALGRPGVA